MDLRKGTASLIFAWIVILVTGYGLTLYFTRRLSMDAYRDYTVVMSVLLWIEIVMINGIPYAVQKFTASERGRAYSILWSGAFIQFAAGVVLYGASYFLSPFLADLFLDKQLTLYFRIVFINILLYGFFHLLASFQNGLGRYDRQALLLIVYAFGKMVFVVLFIVMGHTLVWAFWGNVAGAALGFAAGCFFIREKWKKPVYDNRTLIRFAAPSVLYSLAINMLLSIDFWFVSRLLTKEAGAVYGASSQVARIPYFLVLGLSSAMLSAVASSIAAKNIRKAQNTIEQAIRFLLMLTAPIAILAMLYRREIVSLLFPGNFAAGQSVIGILIWGMTFLAFLVVFTTVINATGKPAHSFLLTLGVVIVDIVLNLFMVPRMGIQGGALASTLAIGAGVLVSAFAVWKTFRFRLHAKPLFRIAAASVIPLAFGIWIPAHGISLIPIGAAALALYALVLFATGEIRKDEVLVLFRSKGKPTGPRVETVL